MIGEVEDVPITSIRRVPKWNERETRELIRQKLAPRLALRVSPAGRSLKTVLRLSSLPVVTFTVKHYGR